MIEPTWSAGDVQLYLGDCLDVLPQLEAESVDAVVTDPPYAELKGGIKISNDGVAKVVNDTYTIGNIWNANHDWIEEAWRVCRFGMIVFCSWHSIDTLKQKLRQYAIGLITWQKRNSTPPINNVPHYTTEFAWIFKKSPGLKWSNLETFYDIPSVPGGCIGTERVRNNGGKSAHPTQKPELLMRHLLRVTLPGDTILDPFMGSGTTGVACVQTGRRFIGVEIDPRYFEIAVKRISEAQLQMRLNI